VLRLTPLPRTSPSVCCIPTSRGPMLAEAERLLLGCACRESSWLCMQPLPTCTATYMGCRAPWTAASPGAPQCRSSCSSGLHPGQTQCSTGGAHGGLGSGCRPHRHPCRHNKRHTTIKIRHSITTRHAESWCSDSIRPCWQRSQQRQPILTVPRMHWSKLFHTATSHCN
jgi:hypothetical protein